jgi:hypothetical protein
MKDDIIRKELLAELRQLRRAPGPFNEVRLGGAEMLIDYAGSGSVEQAFTFLMDLLDRDGADAESDVRAFYETAGYDTSGNNLDERLRAYATRHHVDERTGLRRSDRGADKISYVIRDQFHYDRPWCNLVAVQDGDQVTLRVAVEMPERSHWRRPRVYINGELQDDRSFELHDSKTASSYVTGVEIFRNVPLNLDASEDEPLLELRVFWIMPVWPFWQTGAHLVDPRIYAKLVNNREHSAELFIYWASEEAKVAGGPLAHFPEW